MRSHRILIVTLLFFWLGVVGYAIGYAVAK